MVINSLTRSPKRRPPCARLLATGKAQGEPAFDYQPACIFTSFSLTLGQVLNLSLQVEFNLCHHVMLLVSGTIQDIKA